jgi:uncharacterized protein YlaN (UPF0358 family)
LSQVVAQVSAHQWIGADCGAAFFDHIHDLIGFFYDFFVLMPFCPVYEEVATVVLHFFPRVVDADVVSQSKQPAEGGGDI